MMRNSIIGQHERFTTTLKALSHLSQKYQYHSEMETARDKVKKDKVKALKLVSMAKSLRFKQPTNMILEPMKCPLLNKLSYPMQLIEPYEKVGY